MTSKSPLILLTTDFSAEAGRAYTPVVDLAKRLGAQILLANIVESIGIAPHGASLAPVQLAPDVNAFVKSAETQMAREMEKLGTVVDIEAVCVPATNIAHAITELARERSADYIAISTHGRSGLRRLVLGSVAEAIVRHSSVPVITYPAN